MRQRGRTSTRPRTPTLAPNRQPRPPPSPHHPTHPPTHPPSVYDAEGKGYLSEEELEFYVRDLIPSLEGLPPMQPKFIDFYVYTAVRKFFFFLESKRAGACWRVPSQSRRPVRPPPHPLPRTRARARCCRPHLDQGHAGLARVPGAQGGGAP